MTALSSLQLILTWPSLIEFWVRHLIWPVGLSTFYNLPAVLHPTLRNFVLPAVFDAGVALALLACALSSRRTAFFAAWLVLPLIPLLNIRVFIANDFAHDRYLYLPSVGLAVLAAILLKKICAGPPRWLGMPASLLGAGLCLTAVMGYGTINESSYFKNNLTFYKHVLMKAPHNPYAETNYATLLAEDGQYGPALEKFLDVANQYPDYYSDVYNLALTYYKTGKLPEAEKYFHQAMSINPNKPDQYFYLGMTLFKSGHTPEAIVCLRQAIAIYPKGFVYHLALGLMLKTQGNLAGALQEFQEELSNHPEEQAAAAQAKEVQAQLQVRTGTPRP
ncbi:MAG: tetratricopeptide repeat protein [Terriglobia bacterium]